MLAGRERDRTCGDYDSRCQVQWAGVSESTRRSQLSPDVVKKYSGPWSADSGRSRASRSGFPWSSAFVYAYSRLPGMLAEMGQELECVESRPHRCGGGEQVIISRTENNEGQGCNVGR